jgi:hypothetical protein
MLKPLIFRIQRGHFLGRTRRGVPPLFPGLLPLTTRTPFLIFGVTKDSTSTPLAACTVQLFQTVGDVFVGELVSDASGNYAFTVSPGIAYYIVAYKAGAPDVAGTTVNTLLGA